MEMPFLFVILSFAFFAYSEASCGFMNIPRPKHARMNSFSTKRLEVKFTCQGVNIVQTTGKKKQIVKCVRGNWAEAIPCVKPSERVYTHCETHKQWMKLFPAIFQAEKYPIGKVVRVTCPGHFRLDGLAEVKCEKKGWNAGVDQLKCKKSTCKVPSEWKDTVLNNLNDEYWSGHRILITCPKPEQMAAPLTAKGGIIKCLPDGTWSVEEEKLCKSDGENCEVPKLWKKLFPKMLLKKQYLPGSALILNACPTGMAMSRDLNATSGVATCGTDGSWDVKTPCEVKNCKVPKTWHINVDHVTFGEKVKLPKCPPGSRLIRQILYISTKGKLVCNAQGTFGIDVTGPLCKRLPSLVQKQQANQGHQGKKGQGNSGDHGSTGNHGYSQKTYSNNGNVKSAPNGACRTPAAWIAQFPALQKYPIFKSGKGIQIESCPPGLTFVQAALRVNKMARCANGRWNLPKRQFCVRPSEGGASHGENGGGRSYSQQGGGQNYGSKAGGSRSCPIPNLWQQTYPALANHKLAPVGMKLNVNCEPGWHKSRAVLMVSSVVECMPSGHWNIPPILFCEKTGDCSTPVSWRRQLVPLRNRPSFPEEGGFNVNCPQGTVRTPELQRANGRVKCLGHGRWNIPTNQPFCHKISL
ncbi:uncharacterized protein LOC135500464 [Lineus longissimus]|uniref:uncharacterized protein LOC135500464 n=1 Tax=Lineus longissimus TaxID=88925 RepID=UPI002B4D48A4